MKHQQDLSPAEVYERYLSRTIADPWTRVLLEIADPEIGEQALDLACGTGSVARQLAPMIGESGQVLATDINADMLDVGRVQATPMGAAITWQQGDATHLDLQNDAFDLVVCQQGLQFFPDRAASMHEIRRVLRHGGRSVISVWQGLDQHPLYKTLFTATADHLGVSISDVDVAFSLSEPRELWALLNDAGFQQIEIIPKTLLISMPEPERFVQLSVLGAATSIPAFMSLDTTQRATLINEISEQTYAAVRQFKDGDRLSLSMSTNIAVAYNQ